MRFHAFRQFAIAMGMMITTILIPRAMAPVSSTTTLVRATDHLAFDGDAGWTHDGLTYRLACAPILAEAPNGDLLVAWLSGTNKEPATDNCVLLARSTDQGKSWSEPTIVVPAGKMAGALTTLYTAGDRMIAYGAHWPSDKEYTEWNYFRMESTDNGRTWGERKPLVLNDNHASIGPPLRLANGEILFPASTFRQRAQPLVGSVEKLAHAATEQDALAIPAGKGRAPGKFGKYLHGTAVFVASNSQSSDLAMCGDINNRPLGLLEPTIVQLTDGRIVMLMRAEWGGFLWRAESRDNGRTWSRAVQTDIPSPSTTAALARLADGRIVLINNPTGGRVGANGPRDPLAIWVSDDDMHTWSIKENIYQGGKLAYPNAIITKSGKLVFAYDFNRRQIRFVEVEIPAESMTGKTAGK
jgi:predicted neuraminidase